MIDPFVRELELFNSDRPALVSPQDYRRAHAYVWQLTTDGYVVSTCLRSGRRVRLTHLSRLVTNAPRGVLIDHRDGNPLNCTRGNLRSATVAQNARNRRKPTRGGTGKGTHRAKTPPFQSVFKGVTVDERRRCYHASITVDGRRIDLGKFAHEEDAARAYDKAARVHHGAFARLNFPDKESRRG